MKRSHTTTVQSWNVTFDRVYNIAWTCLVLAEDDDSFEDWLKNNMTGNYEFKRIFNHGSPAIMVRIYNEQDALFFKLTWNVKGQ